MLFQAGLKKGGRASHKSVYNVLQEGLQSYDAVGKLRRLETKRQRPLDDDALEPATEQTQRT